MAPELDQEIDVGDAETSCAYEFKISGKNAWAEFSKDIVKVIIWNRKREEEVVQSGFHHRREVRTAIS